MYVSIPPPHPTLLPSTPPEYLWICGVSFTELFTLRRGDGDGRRARHNGPLINEAHGHDLTRTPRPPSPCGTRAHGADRPGRCVLCRALLSLLIWSMMDFQLLLTWSNRADSLGSCLRMSSPMKMFWGGQEVGRDTVSHARPMLCSPLPDQEWQPRGREGASEPKGKMPTFRKESWGREARPLGLRRETEGKQDFQGGK